MDSSSLAQAVLLSVLLLLVVVEPAPAQEGGRYGHYEVYDQDLPPRAEYAARRARVVERLKPSEAMLVTAREHAVRSNDVEYHYRQRNSMLYLSGVTETGAALLLAGSPVTIDGTTTQQILFVVERNRFTETWNGILAGTERAPQIFGLPVVLERSRIGEVMAMLKPRVLYYDAWEPWARLVDPLAGDTVTAQAAFERRIGQRYPGMRVLPAASIVDSMRIIKSPAEVELLRRAVAITSEAHRQTIRRAEPGMHEYEFEAIMEYEFHAAGAEAPGYTSIVGSGPNTCILHYSSNRRRSKPGELVLMDCGAELHGYSADITRTFPVSGTFTEEQRIIYDLVLEAQTAAIDECRAGKSFWAPHRAAQRVISAGLTRLGILSDPKYLHRYFPHGTSHYLGLDVHDVGAFGALRPGMVITVEPGIYIPAGSDCDPKWWNIGVRIEDDVLITDGEPDNLSKDLERTADEIEALMREGA